MKFSKQVAAAAVTAAAVSFCAPAAHAAITASVIGDDGATPVGLTSPPAAPVGIRNMDTQALSHVDAADAPYWQSAVTGPAGAAASTVGPCWASKYQVDSDKRFVTYQGNGTYTLVVTRFSDADCKAVSGTSTYTWAVNAGVAVGQPAGPLLMRQPNSYSTITQALDYTPNPGGTNEVKYALGGVLAPDGSISGPVQDGYVDSTTGKVQIYANKPGTYLVVARAKNGDFYTPWSPPVTLKIVAPFDLQSTTFPDARGPRYKLRGTVGEPSAGGKVSIAYAKGKKGTHFHGLGSARVNSKGVFTRGFTIRKRGTYRLRYKFSGSATVVKGTVYEAITIRRILG